MIVLVVGGLLLCLACAQPWAYRKTRPDVKPVETELARIRRERAELKCKRLREACFGRQP
jgi:hypothetical protein